MTLPSDNLLSYREVNGELNRLTTVSASLNDSDIRTLAGVGASPSTISFANLQGKSRAGWNLKSYSIDGIFGIAYSPTLGLWAVADSNCIIRITGEPRLNGNFWQDVGQTAPIVATPSGGMVWGANKFVLILSFGYFYTSTDGTTWTQGTLPSSTTPQMTIFANNLFVVVGQTGLIMTSTDGLNWTVRTSGTTSNLRTIIWTGSAFYVCGANGIIIRSSDGITWENVSPGVSFTLTQIATSGTRIVAVGIQSAAQNYCYSSTGNSGSWTVGRINDSGGLSIFGTTSASGVVYTGSQFIVTGTQGVTATSSDGLTWTEITKGSQASGIFEIVNGRIFNYAGVGSSSSFLYEVTSGPTFVPRMLTFQAGSAFSTGISGAYSASANIFCIPSTTATVLTSSDGITWTTRKAITRSQVTSSGLPGSISYTYNNLFIAALNATISTSTDGITWTTQAVTGAVGLLQVSWWSGTYVAVGGGPGSAQIYTSTDLVNWTSRTSPVAQLMMFIQHNGTRFVVLGAAGSCIYSSDGITWTSATLGLGTGVTPIGFIWTGSTFLAAFNNGTIITSSDGISWSSAATSTGIDRAFDFSGLEYFGTASNTPIVRSRNGTSSWGSEFTWGGNISNYFPTLKGGAGGKGIGIIFGDNCTVYTKIPASFSTATGTVLPFLGSGASNPWFSASGVALRTINGWIVLQNASVDDAFVTVPIPFTFTIAGTGYTSVFVGSNSYLTFGSGSTVYSSLSATNPALPKFFLGAADNSYQRVSYYTGSTDYVKIRYEGTASTSGTLGSPNIVYEVTIFNPAKTGGSQVVQVSVGLHSRTTGLFGVASSSAFYASGTIAASQSYVFVGNSAGTSWTINTGSYVKVD